VPGLPGWLRPWPYLLGGALVGFLFLGELALITAAPIQVALLVLALVGLAGALTGRRTLELWPIFVLMAMLTPLLIDSRIVGLPRCDVAGPRVACLAGTRDIAAQFATEILIAGTAAVGVVALTTRDLWRRQRTDLRGRPGQCGKDSRRGKHRSTPREAP